MTHHSSSSSPSSTALHDHDPHINASSTPPPPPHSTPAPEIQIEIVSDEEMAFFEAAMAASRSFSAAFSSRSKSALPTVARSISSRRLPDVVDLEDLATVGKKNQGDSRSLFHKFRKKWGLYVTDITTAEWCEKQAEFSLLLGKRRTTEAMKAGSARHMKLEEEVVTRVSVDVQSIEDVWAVKFLNFVTGVNQLLFQGLTRELPVIGFVEGVCVVGKIDEIRMPEGRRPMLVDTKTRASNSPPSEPQKRNGVLQLMCYKYIWDSLVDDKFPAKQFYGFFSLNPNTILSQEIRETAKEAGIPTAQTLDDIVRYFKNTTCILPQADDQMLLRYELQKDNSLLCQDVFRYDFDWVKTQMEASFEFWFSRRESRYTPEDERWKCRRCQFATVCRASPEFVEENKTSEEHAPTTTDPSDV